MNTDTELLQRYVKEGSEQAFTELVREHLNLVYSAALRETSGDGAESEDPLAVHEIGDAGASLRQRST